ADHYRAAIQVSCADTAPGEGLASRLDKANTNDQWLFDAIRLHGKADLGSVSIREWAEELSEIAEDSWLAKSLEDSPTETRDKTARSALMHALEQKAAL